MNPFVLTTQHTQVYGVNLDDVKDHLHQTFYEFTDDQKDFCTFEEYMARYEPYIDKQTLMVFNLENMEWINRIDLVKKIYNDVVIEVVRDRQTRNNEALQAFLKEQYL